MSPKPLKHKNYASDLMHDLQTVQKFNASNNWLLSYLDVFVLVVMLLVTLLAISDVRKETEKNRKSKSTVANSAGERKIHPIKSDTLPVTENALATATTPYKAPEPSSSSPSLPETEASQPIEQHLQNEFREKIEALGLDKNIKMTINQGFADFEIQDNVLYESSEADLTESGKVILSRLVPLLKDSVGIIMIEGHTDDKPINTARFPSNWELGASRATSVLHFLVSEQLEKQRLRAVSYGDTQPIADNTTPEGREKNRRVNIVIKLENTPQ